MTVGRRSFHALFAVTVAATGVVGAAQESETAQEDNRIGAYIGGGGGSLDHDDPRLENIRVFDAGDVSSAGALKLYGGYRVNLFWGFEGSYETTDRTEHEFSGLIPSIGVVTGTAGAEMDALSFRVHRHVPFPVGSLFAGGGYFTADWDDVLEASDGSNFYRIQDKKRENGLTLDIGFQWDRAAVSLRIEYEWWKLGDADPSQFAFGAHHRF